VYNRAWCVARAIDSAVHFVGDSLKAEIVLVDDGSTDLSREAIAKSVAKHENLSNITFKVNLHEKNRGVCAAKNTGARTATGTWLIFFDSDDELMPSGLSRLQSCLSRDEEEKIHFFTAIGEHSNFVFDEEDRVEKRDFRDYLLFGAGGEALPVIMRSVFLRFPYDEDIRGYESLAYMRLVKHCGPLVIHSLGLRRYYTSNSDRISTKINMRKRRADLISGHMRALREHYFQAPFAWSIKQVARSFYTCIR
jgi:glycosyltransferase involved in cell wall biosynthesis